MRAVVSEPTRHQFGLLLAERGEQARVHAQIGKIVEVLRIVSLDPGTVLRGILCVPDTD